MEESSRGRTVGTRGKEGRGRGEIGKKDGGSKGEKREKQEERKTEARKGRKWEGGNEGRRKVGRGIEGNT